MIQDVSYGGEKYGAPVIAANDFAPSSGGAAAAESQPMLYVSLSVRTVPRRPNTEPLSWESFRCPCHKSTRHFPFHKTQPLTISICI